VSRKNVSSAIGPVGSSRHRQRQAFVGAVAHFSLGFTDPVGGRAEGRWAEGHTGSPRGAGESRSRPGTTR